MTVRVASLFLLTFCLHVTNALAQTITEEETPEITFALPIDCTPGENCFIQNYVDVDPSRRWQDYMCGRLTYNRHKGTDIRLPSMKEMEAGVAVLAAADGRVKGVRNGEEDGLYINGDHQAVSGKECGNGIIITHENGWETQYCHLKKNSVRVQRGQKVKAGTPIASVGLSGASEFTHLHFEVRHNGSTIDPFTGATTLDGCNVPAVSLWTVAARAFLNYSPSGVINQGVATSIPNNMAIERGQFTDLKLDKDSPMLLYFVRIYGLHPGDREELTLTDPDGVELAHDSKIHKGSTKAQYFKYVGKKRPNGGWKVGDYKGHYKLFRRGRILLQRDLSFTVGDTD